MVRSQERVGLVIVRLEWNAPYKMAIYFGVVRSPAGVEWVIVRLERNAPYKMATDHVLQQFHQGHEMSVNLQRHQKEQFADYVLS
jgi:hypothetical protein